MHNTNKILAFKHGNCVLQDQGNDLHKALENTNQGLWMDVVLSHLLGKAQLISKAGASANLMVSHIVETAKVVDQVEAKNLTKGLQ